VSRYELIVCWACLPLLHESLGEEPFQQRARLVLVGFMTDPPSNARGETLPLASTRAMR